MRDHGCLSPDHFCQCYALDVKQVGPTYEGLAANDPTVDPVMAFATRYWMLITFIGGLFAALFAAWMLSL